MRKNLRKIFEAGITLVVTASFVICYYVTKDINAVVTGNAAAAVSTAANSLPEILLDAGHGGYDGGCVGINGEIEKGINLKITKALYYMCDVFGFNTRATRLKDKALDDEAKDGVYEQKKSDIQNRLEFFQSSKNAVCISIHQNKFTDSEYWGAQMFYSGKNAENEKLAQILQETITGALQPDNTREIKRDDEMYVLKTELPAVMVECGFLSNPDEANKLSDSTYQKQMALSVFVGVNKYIQQNCDND